MNPFIKISIKFLKSNKMLAFSFFGSIMITTVLIVSMNNYSYYIEDSYKQNMIAEYGEYDLYISRQETTNIDENVVNKLENNTGIEEISYGIFGYLSIDDVLVYSVGIQDDTIMRSRYKYNTSLNEGEVILNDTYANAFNIKKNSLIQYNSREFKVVDIIEDKTFSADKVYIALFHLNDFKIITGRSNYDFVAIKVYDAESIKKVKNSIVESISNVEVTILKEEEHYQKSVTTVGIFILFNSAIVIGIGALLISSIFIRYLEHSSQNIRIVRYVGGSPMNVKDIITYQTVFLNAFACISGLIFSIILNKKAIEWLNQGSEWKRGNINFRFLSSIGITICIFIFIQVIIKIFIARLVSKLPNQNTEVTIEKLTKVRMKKWKLGLAIIVSSLYACILLLAILGANVFVPMIFCLIAMYILLSLFLADLIHGLLELILRCSIKLKRNKLRIALQLLLPKIKENIFIILAVTSVVLLTLVGSNFQRLLLINNNNYYKKSYLADIKISPIGYMDYEEGKSLSANLDKANIKYISFYQLEPSNVVLKDIEVQCTYYLTSFQALNEFDLIKTALDSNQVIISRSFATRNKLEIGDILSFPVSLHSMSKQRSQKDVKKRELTVSEISDRILYDILIDADNSEYFSMDRVFFDCIFINNEGFKGEEELRSLSSLYQVKWSKLEDVLNHTQILANDQSKMFNVCLNVLLIVIGLGLLNSLNTILYSRRREYKILHCVGMSPFGILKVLLIQIFTYLSIGLLFGIIVGAFILYSINYTETNTWTLAISFKEIFIIQYLLLLSLGTVPEIKRILSR